MHVHYTTAKVCRARTSLARLLEIGGTYGGTVSSSLGHTSPFLAFDLASVD